MSTSQFHRAAAIETLQQMMIHTDVTVGLGGPAREMLARLQGEEQASASMISDLRQLLADASWMSDVTASPVLPAFNSLRRNLTDVAENLIPSPSQVPGRDEGLAVSA